MKDDEISSFCPIKTVGKSPGADCGKEEIPVYVMIKDKNVFCARARGGPPEINREAIGAPREMQQSARQCCDENEVQKKER